MEFGLGLARDSFRFDELPAELRPVAEEVDRKAGEGKQRGDKMISVDEAYRAVRMRDELQISATPAELLKLRETVEKMETRSAVKRELWLYPFVAIPAVIGLAMGGVAGNVNTILPRKKRY